METLHRDKNFKNLKWPVDEAKKREFENCTFINCDFSNLMLSQCKFVDCVFSESNLSMLKLNGSQLNNVTFKDSKLLGINFSESADFLFIVNFDNCVMDYCSFVKKKMPKTTFSGSSMKSVDFTDTDLTKSVFSNVDLLSAVFSNTILKEADLTSARNFSIDPEHNAIKKAKFSQYALGGLLHKYDIKIE